MKQLKEMLSGYKGVFLGLSIAGATLVALGYIIDVSVLSSIGGALFGASLGVFIGRLSTADLTEDLKRLVREGVIDSFVSDEEQLSSYRKNWYLYHLTRMDGKWLWRHTCIDFSKSQTPGRLTSETYLLNQDDEPKYYTVEAGIRDERFILFLRDKATEEPPLIYVFPWAGSGVQPYNLGIVVLQTWDRTDAISRTFICSKPLEDHTQIGTLPADKARKIDKEWWVGIKSSLPPALV